MKSSIPTKEMDKAIEDALLHALLYGVAIIDCAHTIELKVVSNRKIQGGSIRIPSLEIHTMFASEDPKSCMADMKRWLLYFTNLFDLFDN